MDNLPSNFINEAALFMLADGVPDVLIARRLGLTSEYFDALVQARREGNDRRAIPRPSMSKPDVKERRRTGSRRAQSAETRAKWAEIAAQTAAEARHA